MRAAAERELEHLHAREAGCTEESPDFVGDQPQILGDDRRLPAAELGADGLEDSVARAFDPRAIYGRGRRGRHFPGGLEAAEMVDPHQIDQIEQMAEPLDPPAITLAI